MEEVEANARSASTPAQHETIPMPVDASTRDFDHTSGALRDGGSTADDDQLPVTSLLFAERSAVAVDRSQRESIDVEDVEPIVGDTRVDTEDTNNNIQGLPVPDSSSSDQAAPELAVSGMRGSNLIVPDKIAIEETREEDFGWGIVVGELTAKDLNEILSFPELLEGLHW